MAKRVIFEKKVNEKYVSDAEKYSEFNAEIHFVKFTQLSKILLFKFY